MSEASVPGFFDQIYRQSLEVIVGRSCMYDNGFGINFTTASRPGRLLQWTFAVRLILRASHRLTKSCATLLYFLDVLSYGAAHGDTTSLRQRVGNASRSGYCTPPSAYTTDVRVPGDQSTNTCGHTTEHSSLDIDDNFSCPSLP
ncbi:hypothetical protein J3458_009127 [Metarhizium acridum]|uniref:uncharacterized protein n=1 Tax=Metarhizium acridum TaxID=92637 RepID=UPI001C6C0CC5|nr:hypothetical protein J3458_009127 [Metarhizium acridum]